MTADLTGVWWDHTHRHYGWTCPRCGNSGINHQSVESARFSFAAHHCPRHLVTSSRTDRQPPASATGAKGGKSAEDR